MLWGCQAFLSEHEIKLIEKPIPEPGKTSREEGHRLEAAHAGVPQAQRQEETMNDGVAKKEGSLGNFPMRKTC